MDASVKQAADGFGNVVKSVQDHVQNTVNAVTGASKPNNNATDKPSGNDTDQSSDNDSDNGSENSGD